MVKYGRRKKQIPIPTILTQSGRHQNSQNMPHNLGLHSSRFHGFSRAQSQCHAKCTSRGHKSHVFPVYGDLYDHLPTVEENIYRNVEAISTTLTQEEMDRERTKCTLVAT
jgi:hypothetical protein